VHAPTTSRLSPPSPSSTPGCRLQEAESQLRQLMVMQDATLTALQQEKAAAAAARADVDSLRRALEGAHGEVEGLRLQLATAQALAQREGAHSSALLASKAAVEERLTETATRLAAEVQTSTQARDASAAQAAQLQAALDAAARRGEAAESERDALAVRLRESNARVASLLVDNGKLTEAVTALKTELAALRTTNTLLSHGLRPDAPAPPSRVHPPLQPTSAAPSSHASPASLSPPTIPRSSTAAAAALVRATLSAAGLDAGEADRWFPGEHAGVEREHAGGSTATAPPPVASALHLSAAAGGVGAGGGALSPGASALAAALERTRQRRLVREADGANGAGVSGGGAGGHSRPGGRLAGPSE
jgi:hypothetical protein